VSLKNNQIDEVIVQLNEYLEANKANLDVSQNKIAKEIGYSGSLLSSFRQGKYAGDKGRIAIALKQHFEQHFGLY